MRSLIHSAVLLASVLPLGIASNAVAASVCDANPLNIVTNCGFETGNFNGWTLVDPASPPNSYVDGSAPNSGNYSANLGAEPGSLSQTLTDISGQVYDFNFYMQNEVAVDQNGVPYPGANSFGVSVQDANGNSTTLLAPQSIPQTSNFQYYAFNFVGTGTDTIFFNVNNVPSYYNLDDVVVQEQTPEPSSLALMGTGALVFAEFTRRRMKQL